MTDEERAAGYAALGVKAPSKDWSYAQLNEIVRSVLGPNTRVFYKKGAPVGEKDVRICMHRDGKTTPVGWGDSFFDAVVNTFIRPLSRKDELAAELKKAREQAISED